MPDEDQLDALRARLDGIDAALTRLIADRLAVATEVAELKSTSGARLFHRDREERIVAARREAAESLGVDPELTEDIFRRLILASHQAQSAVIRDAAVTETRTIAIIGGAGAMGSFFARLLREFGHTVLISDINTELAPEAAAERADAVLVSVPIAATREIIERVGPRIRPGGALMDVTSLKDWPVRAMLDATAAEVVGAHPLFSPAVGTIHRQVVAICPGRGESWLGWLRALLHSAGAEIVECSPSEHDRAMAVIQVLRHAATMAFGRALRDLGVDIEDSLRFSSPIYRLELIMTGRLFSQDPELYADLGLGNANRAEIADTLERAAAAIARVVRAGDREAFISEFREIAGYFDVFSARAMAESGYLIEKMVERM